MFSNQLISRSTLAAPCLGLVAAVLSGCGGQQADRQGNDPRQAADQLATDAAVYVADPWEKRLTKAHLAKEELHDSWDRRHLETPDNDARPSKPHHEPKRSPASEAMDSPCWMNPDHWDFYVKDGYLVCIPPR